MQENKLLMKKIIAIIAGGDSSEYVISLKSAREMKNAIDKSKYEAFIIFIRKGEWKVTEGEGGDMPVNREDFTFIRDNRRVKPDCALIMIHGTPGEDGILQAYFELINMPYTTCDVAASAISFNKHLCKLLLNNFQVLSPKGVLIKKGQRINPGEITEALGLPVFVKPNSGGSSFGITKVKKQEDLENAVEKAFEEDTQVLIEEFIKGREITCGVFKTPEKEFVFPVTEIVSKKEFFDYEAKYTPGMADEITPAGIPPETEKACKELSSKIYNYLNCAGIVRIDYMFNESGLYFMEINTVPGMSENSIIPQQIRALERSVRDILSLLIEDSLKNCYCKIKK